MTVTFHGKYRGTVANNVDPMQLGRVQVNVPAVLGDGQLSWALPCVPYAGDGVGFFAVPPVGANVWVEFEGGDPAYPILAGCFWGTGQAPGTGLPTTKVLKTDGVTLTFEDLAGAGGLTIDVASPAVSVPMRISCTASGIELSIGSQKVLLSSSSVSVNNGALEVM
ncbi:MAG TPA: phage baseplate assembly protein V [Asanoa sp.]|nr:phage baseplate assembly protein V [Asanoa sp.]